MPEEGLGAGVIGRTKGGVGGSRMGGPTLSVLCKNHRSSTTSSFWIVLDTRGFLYIKIVLTSMTLSPIRLSNLSVIQQCFSLTINQRTLLLAMS